MQNVGLQQFNAVFNGHGPQFFRRQVGQFHAGLVNGHQLLLLQHFARDVANDGEQVLRFLAIFNNRGGMNLKIVIFFRLQVADGRSPIHQGGMEGTIIGADDVRAVQYFVEISAAELFLTTPFG